MSRDRIADAFEKARAESRAALIPYITAGHPSPAVTVDVLAALAQAGADLIELGVPFSDPVADGPVIQRSSQRALEQGFVPEQCLALVRAFRERYETPIILFTYFNPLLAMGPETFAANARAAGIDGLLVLDLTFEESTGLRTLLAQHGLHLISLLAPTTSTERARDIAKASSGFLYYVSSTGVTGQHLNALDEVRERLALLRSLTDLPLAVGFGIQTGPDVRAVAQLADGVVVGSALVSHIDAAGAAGAADAARQFIAELASYTHTDR
jgi:tryptophan synthase alpha chain